MVLEWMDLTGSRKNEWMERTERGRRVDGPDKFAERVDGGDPAMHISSTGDRVGPAGQVRAVGHRHVNGD